jgi:hypothetical protein
MLYACIVAHKLVEPLLAFLCLRLGRLNLIKLRANGVHALIAPLREVLGAVRSVTDVGASALARRRPLDE